MLRDFGQPICGFLFLELVLNSQDERLERQATDKWYEETDSTVFLQCQLKTSILQAEDDRSVPKEELSLPMDTQTNIFEQGERDTGIQQS